MWNIYANNADSVDGNLWFVVAGGYTSPNEAGADVDKIRADWPRAKGFMVGMEIWTKS